MGPLRRGTAEKTSVLSWRKKKKPTAAKRQTRTQPYWIKTTTHHSHCQEEGKIKILSGGIHHHSESLNTVYRGTGM